MVAEKVRRRSQFEGGVWIKMADGQEWLFGDPPAQGVDPDYDGLVQGLLEAEDQHEARKFELAIGMLLLSRNYQPSAREYEEIFSFSNGDAARSSAEEAISTLIGSDLDRKRRYAVTQPRSTPAALRPPLPAVPAFFSSCATHLRSAMAPWLH
jgi:hypothetical protein